MKSISSAVCGITLAAVAVASPMVGCGGDNSTVAGTGGAVAATGGASNSTGGTSSTNTSTSTSAGGCSAPTTVPENQLMTDFSEFADGATATSSLGWGDPSKTLTGGTFTYKQDKDDPPSGVITEGALHITDALPANHYAGFGFYFGPNCGSDASAYTGFSFDVKGDLATQKVELQVQLQQVSNYPKSSDKGSCDYVAAGYDDSTQWNYCTNPSVKLQDKSKDINGETYTTVKFVWADFLGGSPVATLDPKYLLGLQLQFNCGDTACPVDVYFDNLTFYK